MSASLCASSKVDRARISLYVPKGPSASNHNRYELLWWGSWGMYIDFYIPGGSCTPYDIGFENSNLLIRLWYYQPPVDMSLSVKGSTHQKAYSTWLLWWLKTFQTIAIQPVFVSAVLNDDNWGIVCTTIFFRKNRLSACFSWPQDCITNGLWIRRPVDSRFTMWFCRRRGLLVKPLCAYLVSRHCTCLLLLCSGFQLFSFTTHCVHTRSQ